MSCCFISLFLYNFSTHPFAVVGMEEAEAADATMEEADVMAKRGVRANFEEEKR